MSEHVEHESTDEEYLDAIEEKVAELYKYQAKHFEEMSQHMTKEITALHDKHCKVKDAAVALKCQKDFIYAFFQLLRVEEVEHRRKGILVELEVEEVEDHVHEPAAEDKGKEDEPGLYM